MADTHVARPTRVPQAVLQGPGGSVDALPGHEAARPARQRLVGVDAARGVAVIGMLVVNSRPRGSDVSLVWQVAHGRASLLFVLLAGIGVSLLAHGGRHLGAAGRTSLLWRAALLLPAGLLLAAMDHGAKVILPTYAVLFVLAIGAVGLPDRWLLGLVGAIALLGPPAILAVHTLRDAPLRRAATGIDVHPLRLLDDLLVTGGYPLLTWTAPFLLGIAIGRLDLHRRRTRLRLLLSGGGVAAVTVLLSKALVARFGLPTSTAGPEHLVLVTAHSQMPLWLVSGTAAAVAVVGGMLLLSEALGRLARPLVATGQLALTLYVGHLVVLAAMPDRAPVEVGGWTVPLSVALCAGAVVAATGWRSVFRYGPLERLMRVPAALAHRRGRGG